MNTIKSKIIDKKYPEGHYMGQGIAIGMGIGISIGLLMDNIALGPAIGVAIGIAIGSSMEVKAKKEGRIRPKTPEEKVKQKKSLWFGLGIGLLMFIIGLVVFFIVRR